MIIVLTEMGGERLLGRAREIADSLGSRVVALSANKDNSSQKLIYLGADEVRFFDADTCSQWAQIIAHFVRTEKSLKLVIFPSTTLGNITLGYAYAMCFEKIGSCADELEDFDSEGASKKFFPSGEFLARVNLSEGKISLWSVKLDSVPRPFEDDSRVGKVESYALGSLGTDESSPGLGEFSELFQHSASRLTFLIGKEYYEKLQPNQKKDLEGIAKKYFASLIEADGKLRVLEGPCLAIEVISSLRSLPEFKSELVALNSFVGAPISSIAKMYATTRTLQDVVDELISC